MPIFDSYTANLCLLSHIFDRRGSVYMLGISGTGMAPLAAYLAFRGVTVSGVDPLGSVALLDEYRIPVGRSHSAYIPNGCALVVRSLAVPDTSPELLTAARRGIPVITRAALLGAILAGFDTSVAVAGTHGKSTTTAMIDRILTDAGRSPTVFSGATLADGSPLRIGQGSLAVAEACEYRAAFLAIRPTHALVTNIEHDHADFYPTLDSVSDSFAAFLRGVGTAYINPDTHAARAVAAALSGRVITYGAAGSKYPLLRHLPRPRGTDMTVLIDGEPCEFHLGVTGRGNVLDALGAIAVCHSMGVPVSQIAATLSVFRGIPRRLEALGAIRGIPVIYDYAHHPTEIENTLRTLRPAYGRIAAIFKPHTFSRTLAFMTDFARVLSGFTPAVILDVYPAREPFVAGVADTLAGEIGPNALRASDTDALALALDGSPDALVLMGAGNLDPTLAALRDHPDFIPIGPRGE